MQHYYNFGKSGAQSSFDDPDDPDRPLKRVKRHDTQSTHIAIIQNIIVLQLIELFN